MRSGVLGWERADFKWTWDLLKYLYEQYEAKTPTFYTSNAMLLKLFDSYIYQNGS